MRPPQRTDLAEELLRRAEVDQQARSFFDQDTKPTDVQVQHCQTVDADNTTCLEAIVIEHGWPGIRLVGEQGAGPGYWPNTPIGGQTCNKAG